MESRDNHNESNINKYFFSGAGIDDLSEPNIPQKSSEVTTDTKPVSAPISTSPEIEVKSVVTPKIQNYLKETEKTLMNAGLTSSAKEISQLNSEVAKNRFTVAVVGEFSRGKSSFINSLFNRDLLPVANSPTTAMLTRIRYNHKDMLVIYSSKDKAKKTLPLNLDSWRGYTATIDGSEPSGVAFVGFPDPWLKQGIEIIDTPGAGDLEEKRTAVIGDALRGSDSAIITVSAEQILSMSEKLFIEERLIGRKVPFLMLIITKLDRIPPNQRAGIIEYVKTKLKMWKFDIPVFVPNAVEIPGSVDYSSIMGIENIKKTINSWVVNPKRVELTLRWLSLKIISVLQTAINTLNEQLLLNCANDEDRKRLISQKSELISNAELEWENLKLKMIERCDLCCQQMNSKVTEYTHTITERMQYEASHTVNPEKWWAEDFSYRLKVELTALANSIENSVTARVSEDSKWFNAKLEKNFHTNILITQENVIDKHAYTDITVDSDLKFENINQKRNASKIGLSVLSIAGYAVCSAIGVLPIIATMGVSTVGSMATEGIFRKKIEQQIEDLKKEIAEIVPKAIDSAAQNSHNRVKSMYSDMLTEAAKQEKKWIETQQSTIASSVVSLPGNSKENDIRNSIISLTAEIKKYELYVSN